MKNPIVLLCMISIVLSGSLYSASPAPEIEATFEIIGGFLTGMGSELGASDINTCLTDLNQI